MKISISPDGGVDNFTGLIGTMSKSGQNISIGNNPVLPTILQETWGWPQIHVSLEFKGEIIGFFQALKVRGIWVSLPHFDHSGLWIDVTRLNNLVRSKGDSCVTDQQAYQLLLHLVGSVLSKAKIQNIHDKFVRVEVDESDLSNTNGFIPENSAIGLTIRSEFPLLPHFNGTKVLSVLELQNSVETQMKTFTSNVRRKIRKSYKNGVKITQGGSELVKCFYRVYRKNIHQLGSFALPMKFFHDLMKSYNFGSSRIILASYLGNIIGAAVYLDFMGYAENAWFASLKEGNNLYVTYALHNEMIKLAIENNCISYSFGRSTIGSSGHKYKKQWGGGDEVLYLCSTSKIADSATLYKLASPIVKILPQGVGSIFDTPISRIIY